MRSWNYNHECRCRMVNCSGCTKLHDRIYEAVCPVLLLFFFFIIWIHNKSTCFWTLRLTINNNVAIIYCLPTPCGRVLLGKLTIPRLFKKWPAFYVSWKFITESTRARQPFLSGTRLIQSIPGPENLFWYSPPTCAFFRRTDN